MCMEVCALSAALYYTLITHWGYTVQFDVLSDHTDLYKILKSLSVVLCTICLCFMNKKSLFIIFF